MNYIRFYNLHPLTYNNNQAKNTKSNAINGEEHDTYLDGEKAQKCNSKMAPIDREEDARRRATIEKKTRIAEKKKKSKGAGCVFFFI